MAETSQDPIGPCGPLEQSVEISRHSAMAAWSFALDVGAQPNFGAHIDFKSHSVLGVKGLGHSQKEGYARVNVKLVLLWALVATVVVLVVHI